MYIPDEEKFGRFSTSDGTIDLYLRVREAIDSNSVVLDVGAGRGAWFEDDDIETRRAVRYLLPDVSEVIAIDVDDAVLKNKSTSKNMVYDGSRFPVNDESVDVVIADYVLEHFEDPIGFCSEVSRVLKPGGLFCARTPHLYNYVAVGARLIVNSNHKKVLARLQPGRKPQDVFPTQYKLNRLVDIRKYFPNWKNQSFLYRADPSYYFGNKVMYAIVEFLHRISPIFLVGNLFVFVEKPVD